MSWHGTHANSQEYDPRRAYFGGETLVFLRGNKIHTLSDMRNDVGGKNARILWSERFWYFGRNAEALGSEEYPGLCDKLRSLNQGHRVKSSYIL
jgi:hypothetical protein